MEVKIIPAILASSRDEFEFNLKKVRGIVNRVQVDIIDGVFAEKETISPEILTNYVSWGMDFEVHLMVNKPELWLSRCKDGVVAVVGQVEMMTNQTSFIADAELLGFEVGLAYDIKTNLDSLGEVIDGVDKMVLLAVTAGKQGQSFDERVLKKIQQVRAISKRIVIGVDGGLDERRIKQCLAVEDEFNHGEWKMEFVVGSNLWQADNVIDKLEKLQYLGIK